MVNRIKQFEDHKGVDEMEEDIKNLIIGIDPGISGGFAVRSISGKIGATRAIKKDTPADTINSLRNLQPKIIMCYIERVASRPKQGVVSTFKFGTNFGMYIGALTALQIPHTFVTPSVWQRFMGCLSKGDKNVTKRKAQEIFPCMKITHAVADALLIAEYGRRIELKTVPGVEDI